MSFTEFAYPLMQAYDWWQLYDSKGVQLQIGGADQYGNILAGAESVKYLSKNFIGPATAPPPPDHDVDIVNEPKKAEDLKAAYGFTVPLLTTSSGEKIGKSAGNAIWLDNELTSVFDLYQVLCAVRFERPLADTTQVFSQTFRRRCRALLKAIHLYSSA